MEKIIHNGLNAITKIALIQYIMNLEIDKHKGWVQYVLLDAAYITMNEAMYPYKGDLSYRFILFAAGLNKNGKRVYKDNVVQNVNFPIGCK